MDLATIRTRAQTRFRDLSSLIVGTQTWDEHINAAYRHFLRAARWPFLTVTETYAVTAGQRLVNLTPTTVGITAEDVLAGLEEVYDATNDAPIEPMPVNGLAWRLRNFLQRQFPGKPALFRVVGKNLFLIPSPLADIDITVFWYQDPGSLTADDQEPAIPERYHEALVTGAVAKAHLDDQNREAADEYQQEFEAIVSQAVSELMIGTTEALNQMAMTQQPLEDTGISADRR